MSEEKRISREEFDIAVKKVIEEMMKDEELEGMAKLMIPLIVSMFSSKVISILFKESEDAE